MFVFPGKPLAFLREPRALDEELVDVHETLDHLLAQGPHLCEAAATRDLECQRLADLVEVRRGGLDCLGKRLCEDLAT